MSIKIFTMAHKKFDPPKDPMYIPLQVGRATGIDLGYLGDDTGDHISDLNCYFSELTGVYWIWKNYKECAYVGVCHYRRYLVNEDNRTFTEAEYLDILKKYDIITTKRLKLNCDYYDGYAANHQIKDLIATSEVIREKYPEYYEVYDKTVHSNETYFGNICVTSKVLFDEYASWLFSIFFEVQKRINIDSYDDYHKRVFGFISEILLLVWVKAKGLRPYECKVGMICEKIETIEMKHVLASYFEKKDIQGAKHYFSESLKKRPDVLMEASDINGELKLAMQVIATSDMEYADKKTSILDESNEFHALILHTRRLNDIVERYKFKKSCKEDAVYLVEHKVSSQAIKIAAMLLCKNDQDIKDTLSHIAQDMEIVGRTDKAEELLRTCS